MGKLVALIIVALLTSAANADSVYTGLYTSHLVDNGHAYYERNDVFIYELDNGVHFGRMINSFERESYLFGYRHKLNTYLNTGVVLATGYAPDDLFGNGAHEPIILLPMPFIGVEIPVSPRVSLSAQWIGVVINTGLVFSL